MALQAGNTTKAYSLWQNNCRHFSTGLIHLMRHNSWHDQRRLYRPFIFRALVDEWKASSNSWILTEDSQ